MSFERSADLHPDLTPIAWMIGRWEGSGKATYPGTEDFDFGQQIDFATMAGTTCITSRRRSKSMIRAGDQAPWHGDRFWRPQPDGSLEVVMCHAAGYAEVWYGSISGAKVELATDAVVRTALAEDYAAGQRLRQRCGDLRPSMRVHTADMWARLRV